MINIVEILYLFLPYYNPQIFMKVIIILVFVEILFSVYLNLHKGKQ